MSKVIRVSEKTYSKLVTRAKWEDTLDDVIQRLIRTASVNKMDGDNAKNSS